jgi:hypothetical protein
VLALGTDDELRVPVGPGTYIPIVGVAPSNLVYQILLCQAFHHITGGMVNPVLGLYTYPVNLWDYNDSSVIGTLEGVSSPSHEGPRTAHVTVQAKREQEGDDNPRTNQDENPLPSPPARIAMKWVLPASTAPVPQATSGDDTNSEVSQALAVNVVEGRALLASSQKDELAACKAELADRRSRQVFEDADMWVTEPHSKENPADELMHIWSLKPPEGFWLEASPEDMGEGCLCWRCVTSCRMEIPNQAMPPIREAEWRGIEAFFEHHTRQKHIWDDLVDQDLEDEKPEAYRAAAFDH